MKRALPLIGVGAMLLVGCGGIVRQPDAPAPAPAADAGIGIYLETMQRLANSSPAEQADVFYEVERSYTAAPTTANSLRRAVALVTPGHPASNPADGKKMLEQLLANPERLSPQERNLAGFLVKDADARLQLQADIRRLTATMDERARTLANSERRIPQMQDENARLRRALEEAQQKLEALKSIEMRSIIERNAPPANNRDTPPRN